MAWPWYPMVGLGRDCGQASLLLLDVMAALLAGTLILFGFGHALGARGSISGRPISPPSPPRR
jgi:hypothetical protein